MSEAERHAAALADPDAQPLTPERLTHMKRTPQVKVIRRALGLSQEDFAERFQIPLGTLRDWEQGRKDPDAAARAYLVVIGRNPGAVSDALSHGYDDASRCQGRVFCLMRPSLLDPLFAPAATLPGVGPKNAKLFDRLLDRPQGARVVDLLFHLPQATLDRRARPKIADAVPDTHRHDRGARRRASRAAEARARKAPFKVLVEDDTGDVELVFFLANPEWIARACRSARRAGFPASSSSGTASGRSSIPTG